MNNEMRRERAMQLKREAEALRDKAGKVSTPLTEANALCARAKELDACAEQIIADAAARADDACSDPVGHPLTCDCPFGPVANESN